jgi:methanogenic corrinoid protein MtbC1
MESDRVTTIERVASALLSINNVYLKLAYESSGMEPNRFAEEVLVPVLDTFGDRWQNGELSLAQVYMSGRMCERLLDEYPPIRPVQEQRCNLAIAVLEDFHVLGKRIVCSVMNASGYEYKDYGPISLDDLVEKVRADSIRILLVSTLMLSSALRIKLLKERLNELGMDVKVIVGGAPFRFDPNLWCEVGADATSSTATGVVSILNRMIAEAPHDNL